MLGFGTVRPAIAVCSILYVAVFCTLLCKMQRSFLQSTTNTRGLTSLSFTKTVNTTKGVIVQPVATPRSVLNRTCCASDTSFLHGRFVAESLELVQFLMEEMKQKRPFAWVRWGDGEIQSAVHESDYGRRLKSSLLFLSSHNQSVVNVGMHWLRQPRLAALWNQAVPKNGDNLFHQTFYLPMGDPIATKWREQGVLGWSVLKVQANYKVVLVGPRHLRGLPFVNETVYIGSERVEHHTKTTDTITRQCVQVMEQYQSESLLFLLAAGRSTKIIIADLMKRKDNIHTFVDVGSSLDGFAGVKSRDYSDPNKYCKRIKQRDPDNLHFWMKPGACEEIEKLPFRIQGTTTQKLESTTIL